MNFEFSKFDRYMLTVIVVIVATIAGLILLGDQIGVAILEFNPAHNARVSTNTELMITFDQPMDRESAEDHFLIDPSVEGSFRWRGATLDFVPRRPLQPGQTYIYGIEKGARSASGRQLDNTIRRGFSTRWPTMYYLSPANVTDASLWALDLENGSTREIYSTSFGIFDFATSPDGTQIAVTVYGDENATADIWLIEADGSNPRQLTDCAPGACGRPVWSPDGNLLAYERQNRADTGGLGPSRVWVLDMNTDETVPVFEDSQVLGYWAAWGPVGNVLSFYDSNITGIRIIDLDSGVARIVGSELPDHWAFTPDGQTLLYTDLRNEGNWYYSQILRVNLDSDSNDEAQPLLENPQEDQQPVMAPDGEWLAFRRRLIDGSHSGGWHIALYHFQTGDIIPLIVGEDFTCRDARWFPGGGMLLFQCYDITGGFARSDIWVYSTTTQQFDLVASDASMGHWGS